MDPMDPIPWADVLPVTGTPGVEVEPFVDRHADAVREDPPAVAVKTVYDDWKDERVAETDLSAQAAAFLIAYLLEHRGAVEFDGPMPSLVERRATPDRLRELVHDEEKTLWWIAVERGVHYALVTRWCYEADVPLLRRNFTDETFERIQERLAG